MSLVDQTVLSFSLCNVTWCVWSLKLPLVVVLLLDINFKLNLRPRDSHTVYMLVAILSTSWPKESCLLYRVTFQPLTGFKKITVMRQRPSFSLSCCCPVDKSHEKATCGDVELQPSQTYHTSKATLYGKPVFLEEKKRQELSDYNDYIYSTHTRHSKSTKHCTQTQKCHNPFYATAGIVAYAHWSTNPTKFLRRLTEAMG